MKIYTKTGDKGQTGLFGGDRVDKDDLRIHAYGLVDELNACLGIAVTEIHIAEIKSVLLHIQNKLFTLGSDLSTPLYHDSKSFVIPRITSKDSEELEDKIDYFESKLELLKNFILPGGTKGAAQMHFACTICRRAERRIVTLMKTVEINENILIFVNRLSDLLFVLSRYENHLAGQPDIKWEK